MLTFPPSLELVLSECDPATVTFKSFVKKLRDKVFVKELKDQAVYTAENFEYPGSKRAPADSEFVLHGCGGLNPLSLAGKCSTPGCREENALAFARSIGLYADYAVITDFLTERLYSLDPQDPDDISWIFGDLRALHVVSPLIREGILKLGDSIGNIWPACEKDLFGFSPKVATNAWRHLESTGEVEFWDGPGDESVVAIGGHFFGGRDRPSFIPIRVPSHEAKALRKRLEWRKGRNVPPKKFRMLKALALPYLEMEAKTLLFEARETGIQGAILATESRFDVVALRGMDKATITQHFGEWEHLHSCRLPWISELTIDEILRLRDEARRALPQFRARIKKDLFSLPAKVHSRDAYAAKLDLLLTFSAKFPNLRQSCALQGSDLGGRYRLL